jgi:hypothetical protein
MLRGRLRSYVGVAVLLALLGGLSLASLAGARRTASAYQRFRVAGGGLAVQVYAGGAQLEPEFFDRIRTLPGVTGTASYLGFVAGKMTPDGRPDLSFRGEVGGSLDRLYFTRDRFSVIEGRLPEPSRPDEVAVNEHMAKRGGLRLGERVEMGLFDPAQEEAVYGDAPPRPVDRVTVTVVGIGLYPDEVVQDDTDRLPRMLCTPAFTEPRRQYASYAWTGFELKGGPAAVGEFKRAYLDALPGEATASYRESSAVTDRAQRAVRPLAGALGVFGALAAAAGLLLVGQALVRLIRSDREDLATVRALGGGPRLTSTASLPGSMASVLLGVLGAVGVATALSPLAPIGPVRRVEVHPGLVFDWTVLGLGAGGFTITLGLVAMVLTVRQTPHRRATRRGASASGSSTLIGAVSRTGLPLPGSVGARLAFESGEGRGAVPVRAVLGGAVVAVVALVASLVFGASLQGLVDHPKSYGWDWDLTLYDEAGYGSIGWGKAHDVLDTDPAVDAWAGVSFGAVQIDGRNVNAVAIDPPPASGRAGAQARVGPPIVSGHAPTGPDEVVLGATTLADIDRHVGDSVSLGDGDGERRVRIVGTAVFPTIGPVFGGYASLGQGALLPSGADPKIFFNSRAANGPPVIYVRFRPGADARAAAKRIADRAPELGRFAGTTEVLPVQRPAEIVNYTSMGSTPALLAGLLVFAALMSLGLALTSGVGKRRRELSVLKSLGFTRRQVSATVVWQSSIIVMVGLVIGGPLGIVLGRWLWTLFAQQLAVLAVPVVPLLTLAAFAVGLLVMAAVVSSVPARRAGHTPVAAILRSE